MLVKRVYTFMQRCVYILKILYCAIVIALIDENILSYIHLKD